MKSNIIELNKFVENNNFYINATSYEEEKYTLMCLRHAISESHVDLYNMSIDIVKENSYTLGDNEYFMFEWLAERQTEHNKEKTLILFEKYITEPLFNKKNHYIKFEYTLLKSLDRMIAYNKIEIVEAVFNIPVILEHLITHKLELFIEFFVYFFSKS